MMRLPSRLLPIRRSSSMFAAAKKISTVEFKRNINILEAMATGPGMAFEVLKKDAIVFIKPEWPCTAPGC